MNLLLIFAAIVAVVVANTEDLKPESAANPVSVYDDKDDDHHGPHVLRVVNANKIVDGIDHHRDIEKQNEIIRFAYSPVYYEPTWILDYRFLKSGGRDYVRGPGGQILILPKNVRAKDHGYQDEHHDYDSLIEYLKIKHLPDTQREPNFQRRHGDDYDRSRSDMEYGRMRHNPYIQYRQH